jgi:uncharacterized protein YegL
VLNKKGVWCTRERGAARDGKDVHLSDFSPAVKHDNRDPRVACALLLDTSSSMGGEPIAQLNKGYAALREAISEDPLARKRTEISVVTFGGSAQVAVPFTEGRDLAESTFHADGGTPMGAALDLGLDQLLARKQSYKEAGLEYFRPWLFVITDGAPTDGQRFTDAAARVRDVEAKKGVTVFAVGVQGAEMSTLAQFSAAREPLLLDGLKFIELFEWLSASMSVVSQSSPGASDDQIASNEEAEQTPLPSPRGWAHL